MKKIEVKTLHILDLYFIVLEAIPLFSSLLLVEYQQISSSSSSSLLLIEYQHIFLLLFTIFLVRSGFSVDFVMVSIDFCNGFTESRVFLVYFLQFCWRLITEKKKVEENERFPGKRNSFEFVLMEERKRKVISPISARTIKRADRSFCKTKTFLDHR